MSEPQQGRSEPPFDCPEQLVLAAHDDGAVLLDLKSGSFYRLNPTAQFVAQGLIRGESVGQVGERLARTFGISLVQASADVQAWLAQLRAAPVPGGNPLRFESCHGGHLLTWSGCPICHIDQLGMVITDRAPTETLPGAAQRLLWTVPHVLMLRGYFVLHAAAVQEATGIVAFCGPSGTGKTTLARLFADRGSKLLAEDMLVIELAAPAAAVYTTSETAIRRWVAARGRELATAGRVGTDDLIAAVSGPQAPIETLLFPRRVAPASPVLVPEPIGRAEALALLLENSFAELVHPQVWRLVWEGSRRLAEETRIGRLRVPEGLALLADAVAAQSRTVKW